MKTRTTNLSSNENGDIVVEDPELELEVPEIEEPAFNSPWAWKRIFYRGLMIGSDVLSPLFVYFLYQSIANVRDMTLKEFEMEDSAWASHIFTLMAIYFTTANLLGDPPSINPIEEAEDLFIGNGLEEKETNACSQSLVTMNKILAIPSFAHFAADNAIALAGLTSNNRSFSLGLGIPFTLFSVTHQYIMTKKDLEDHGHRFIKALRRIHTAESFLLTIVKAPLRSLEVAIEALSHIASQAIEAGYIAGQLAFVFSLAETDPVVLPWVVSATFLTAYVTAFSQVLPPYEAYFNPQFNDLTANELKEIKLPLTDLLLDGGIALTRALALGWLSCRFGPQDRIKKALLATGVCLTSFIHPFYVLYQKQKYEAALENRKNALSLEIAQIDEAGAALPEKLFDKIAKHYETPALRKAVTVINVSARIGQLLSFIGFVATVWETVKANGYLLDFNFKDIIALAILWGTPIAILEGRANQKPLIESATYYRAKIHIGPPTEAFAQENVVTRTVGTFFYSKRQYSNNKLREALRLLDNDEIVEMAPLLNLNGR